MCSSRMGHFAPDAAEQKARLQHQKFNTVDFFVVSEPSANKQWAKMVRRELPAYDWVRFLSSWNRLIPGGEGLVENCSSSQTLSRDLEGLYYKFPSKFAFTVDEEREAKAWLVSQGWQEGEQFICLLVRDEAYLRDSPLHGDSTQASVRKWSYHDYRNSDIFTYQEAMEWLVSQGAWVLRMGQLMEKPLSSVVPKLIDYAFSSEKSDLLDIWLFANCSFCISTGTGIDAVSHVYHRPILFLNASPLTDLNSYHQSTWVPKHLQWSQRGQPLRLKDYLNHNYGSSEQYQQAGLEMRDLNAEEILMYTQEFWQRLQGTWQDSESDLHLHRKFWEVFESGHDYQKYHGWRHPESRVSTTWLRQQPEQFFE